MSPTREGRGVDPLPAMFFQTKYEYSACPEKLLKQCLFIVTLSLSTGSNKIIFIKKEKKVDFLLFLSPNWAERGRGV